MKVKVTDTILDPYKEPFEQDPVKKTPLTWRHVIYTSVNTQEQNEQMTAEDKVRCYQITKKTFDSNEPDFTLEERAYILTRIAKFWSPFIYGKATEVFDKEKKDEVSESKP